MTAVYWCRPIEWDKVMMSSNARWGCMSATNEEDAIQQLEWIIASEVKRILVRSNVLGDHCSRLLSMPHRSSRDQEQLVARIQQLGRVWQIECEQCPLVHHRGGCNWYTENPIIRISTSS